MNKNHQDPLRKLARGMKYQSLYSRASELTGIQIFDNTSDFSSIQLDFLYWLTLYHRLYQDLVMGVECLTQEVIDDDLLCDCYLIWERKVKRPEELAKIKNPNYKPSKKTQIDRSSTIPSVVFSKA